MSATLSGVAALLTMAGLVNWALSLPELLLTTQLSKAPRRAPQSVPKLELNLALKLLSMDCNVFNIGIGAQGYRSKMKESSSYQASPVLNPLPHSRALMANSPLRLLIAS